MTQEATSKYAVLINNCADASSQTLKTVGLDPGWSKIGPIKDRWGHNSESWFMTPLPNVRYEEIIRNNNSKLVTTITQ